MRVDPNNYLNDLDGIVKDFCMSYRVQYEDFIGEGWIALYRAAKRYVEQEGASFNTYMYQCVRGSLYRELRRVNEHKKATSECKEDVAKYGCIQNTPFDIVCAKDKVEQILKVLNTTQTFIVLNRYKGYSFPEIGSMLGCTRQRIDQLLKPVKSKIERIIQRDLRKANEDCTEVCRCSGTVSG